ncbi:MAG: hypothetical protein EXS63_00260 [Candidatus Omnitrophica bacterium]|nr:hypothetical protein [Candidatus Omnitrophota bacterium]
MLILGIPKEIKTLEKRVGLTPDGASHLIGKGITVLVETRAGAESGFSDADYQKAGAQIIPSPEKLYALAGLIQKVKEPLSAEFPLLRKEHTLFCFLHLASQENCALKDALVHSRCTAVGFETLRVDGRLPLLAPMSQIAGGLAAGYAAMIPSQIKVAGETISYHPFFRDEMETIAKTYPKANESYHLGSVVIFGAGVAGIAALEVAKKLGGRIIMIEKNLESRKRLASQGIAVLAPEDSLDDILKSADVLIGCAHAMGQRANYVITQDQLAKASIIKKKIILDISIDQGGNFPESHSTSYQNPLCLDSLGNIRFAVPNIPSLAGTSASRMLTEASLPYTELLALKGPSAFESSTPLSEAINIRNGEILIEAIRQAHTK